MIWTISASSLMRSTTSSGIISGQLRDGHARAALVPGPEANDSHPRILTQHLAHTFTKRSCPLPMDDPKLRKVSPHRRVDSLHNYLLDLEDAHAPDVDLGTGVNLRHLSRQGHRNLGRRLCRPTQCTRWN